MRHIKIRPIQHLIIILALMPCLVWADGVGPYISSPGQQEAQPEKFAIDRMGSGNGFAGKATLNIRLPVPKDSEMDSLRKHNSKQSAGKAQALQIGYGRDMPSGLRLSASNISWINLADGRLATQVQLTSPGAKALRVGLSIKDSFLGELRFAGSEKPQQVFGPYRWNDWQGQKIYWSPSVEGETITLEIVLPAGQKGLNGDVEIAQVSHIVANPTQGNQFSNLSPDTYKCEVDIECSTNTVVKNAAKGVARMLYTQSGGTYVCSGTLLNDSGNTQQPWFYTAHHCISTQTVASTLNTFFFYENSGCYTTNSLKSYKQLTRGATYIDSEVTNDHSFLKLNESAPAGVVFNAWSTSSLTSGQDIVGIHHPHGDMKKVSLGYVSNPASSDVRSLSTGQILKNLWQVSYYSGTTEPGSSGSGLFYCNTSYCELRGGLFGGLDNPTCSYGQNSAYSRFDVAYPRISSYLSPSTTTTPTPTPTPTTKTASSSYANGVLTIKNLEVDNGDGTKSYYNVTMKLRPDLIPLRLLLDTVTPAQ